MHSGELGELGLDESLYLEQCDEKFKALLQVMNSGNIRGLRYCVHVKTDADTRDMILIDSKLMRVIKLDA